MEMSRIRRALGTSARFLVVGGLSTIIEVAVFNVLIIGFAWDVPAAKIVASLVALVNAYFGNRHWAFRGRRRRGRGAEILLFLAANAVCMAVGVALVSLGVSLMGSLLGHAPNALIVNIINLASIGVVVVLRFAMYHLAVFRPRPPVQDERTEAVSSAAKS